MPVFGQTINTVIGFVFFMIYFLKRDEISIIKVMVVT